MADLAQLTLQLRGILVLSAAADLPEAERAQGAEVAIGLADPTANLRDLQLAHSLVSSAGSSLTLDASGSGAASSAAFSSSAALADTGSTWAIVLPRSAATSSGRTRLWRPLTV